MQQHFWHGSKCSFSFDYSANRKKAEARKTGGGPAPPPLTNAEEMALSLNAGRPMAEGIPGGTSSEPVTPEDLSAFIKCKRSTYVLCFYIGYLWYFHLFYFGVGFSLVPTDSDGKISLLEPPVPTEPQAVVSSLLNTPEIITNSVIKCTQMLIFTGWWGWRNSFCCHRDAYRGNVNIMCLSNNLHIHISSPFLCGVAYRI